MLMILSLSVVYAAPPGLWPLSNYAPSGVWPPPGLCPLPEYSLHRTMPPAGLWPLSDYGLPPGQSKVFAM